MAQQEDDKAAMVVVAAFNALNMDHAKTTSMPNHMAELGSANFDQELTLSLLGSENDALNQIEAAIGRIETGR